MHSGFCSGYPKEVLSSHTAKMTTHHQQAFKEEKTRVLSFQIVGTPSFAELCINFV